MFGKEDWESESDSRASSRGPKASLCAASPCKQANRKETSNGSDWGRLSPELWWVTAERERETAWMCGNALGKGWEEKWEREGEIMRDGENRFERETVTKGDGSSRISGLIGSLLLLSGRGHTQKNPTGSADTIKSSPSFPPSLLHHQIVYECSCFLSPQSLIRACQLRGRGEERHSILSVSPSFPSLLLLFHPLIPHFIVLPFDSRPLLLSSCSIILSPSSPNLRHHFHQPAFSISLYLFFPPLVGLYGDLDKWAQVDGWGAGHKVFQSTQWNPNSSWDCVEKSPRRSTMRFKAKGRSVKQEILAWCFPLQLPAFFLSSLIPYSSPAESGKSLLLRILSRHAGFPGPNRLHPSAWLRASLTPPEPLEPR